MVCNFSPDTPTSQSGLNISAAGKYGRAPLDRADASLRRLFQRSAADKGVPRRHTPGRVKPRASAGGHRGQYKTGNSACLTLTLA